MGNCGSLCCRGVYCFYHGQDQQFLTDGVLGRPREGLYEPALADSEREAVADLLQYLENVCNLHGPLRDPS